jgi:hypothetical protein
MTTNTRCLICDVAYDLQMSEQMFYERFDKSEREQVLATYLSQRHREYVISKFPPKSRKG